jgi:methylmalonyl-CoA/ethylmalonyl-CoA epimerase
MFKVGGTFIELLEPKTHDSVVAKFISERGEGIHHIALRVENINDALREITSRGLRVVYSSSRNLKDRRINFIHPRDTHGVMIELVERFESYE